MSVLKIPMLLLKIPLLVILSLLQTVLNTLDRLSGFFTGLLTLVLVGFWIHHCILGNRDNVIVLQHDIHGTSVDAVEEVIIWGLQNGYTFLPLTTSSPACEQVS